MPRPYIMIRILTLILLGFALYANTLTAEFQFDDKDFIVNNAAIRDITDMSALWNVKGEHARFLSFLTFALNYHFHQLDVTGYHLVNVAIHVINACLVYWFAILIGVGAGRVGRRQTVAGSPVASGLPSTGYRLPFIAALIFLTHPIQTETVSYISQRFASLATMFYLAALCCWITARGRPRGAVPAYALCAVFAVAAMLSKQIAFTLPFTILLIEIYFLNTRIPWDVRRRTRDDDILATDSSNVQHPTSYITTRLILLIGAFVLSLLFIPFLYDFNTPAILGREYISRSHEGDYLNGLTYLLTQFRVLVVYLRLLVFPVGLNFDYDFPASTTLFDPATFGSFLLLLALFGLGLWLFNRQRVLSFCIMWFFLTLSVESTIVVLPHVIFEHRLYLPMVGFSLFTATIVLDTAAIVGSRQTVASSPVATRLPATGYRLPNGGKTFSVIIITIYAALTYQRNEIWRSGVALWTDVIQKSPAKSRPYHNRGFHYLEKGEYAKAIADFNAALKRNPGYLQAYSNRASAHRALGRSDLALADYNTALELQPVNAQALLNRGTLYAGAGRTKEALDDFERAFKIAPDHFLIYHNRGRLYLQTQQYETSLADFSEAIRLRPDFPFAYAERGKAYLYMMDHAAAIADFTRAIALNPRDAKSHNNRAIAHARQKDYAAALADFTRTIELDPDNSEAYLNRSLLYVAMGELEKAREDAEKARQLGGGTQTGAETAPLRDLPDNP